MRMQNTALDEAHIAPHLTFIRFERIESARIRNSLFQVFTQQHSIAARSTYNYQAIQWAQNILSHPVDTFVASYACAIREVESSLGIFSIDDFFNNGINFREI